MCVGPAALYGGERKMRTITFYNVPFANKQTFTNEESFNHEDDALIRMASAVDGLSAKNLVKELAAKYPSWLELTRDLHTAEQLDGYQKQYDCLLGIAETCDLLDAASEAETKIVLTCEVVRQFLELKQYGNVPPHFLRQLSQKPKLESLPNYINHA
eukprot:comp19125_c0_seq1/m.21748 comp19125_c0_seq1/g.21748  ORF comp19125_c0_seq1/g.21748 comp19125_c0_seq1/m.21748 type:complete len:157 (-) comp19125_c0_seq1:497-967(-)